MIAFLFFIFHSIFKIINTFVVPQKNSNVVLKTNHFIIIDKAYDLKINSNNINERTLQTFMKKTFPKLASNSLCHEFYFMHRLDYSTSGLICIPIHKKACQAASKALETKKCRKYYIALVRGFLSQNSLNLKYLMGQDVRFAHIEKMKVIDQGFTGKTKKSQTLIVVLEKGSYDNYPATKILVRPITGKRHQIRVHCAHIGHTIIGDYTYSNKKDTKPFRMFLHSIKLVVPNEVENINCETADPFISSKINNWKPLFCYNSLEEGYLKLDKLHEEK